MREELVSLLSDVLAELQIEVCATLPAGRTASLVLAGTGPREIAHAVAVAKGLAGAVPLVAVVPFQDRKLAATALRGGADGCYALGTPVSRLRILVAQLLILHWTQGRWPRARRGTA
jgi:hypothetical protein